MQDWLGKKLKISHHRHSGRVLHRDHTSHWALAILAVAAVLIVGLALKSEDKRQTAVAGDITVTGNIPGPPPTEPPVIDEPKPGDSFTKSPIDITGRRPGDNIVEIYSNGIFSGAAGCVAGAFNAKISLITGNNELKARTVDALGQHSPFSEPFNIGFLPKITSNTSQFYIVPSTAYYGRLVGQSYPLEANLFGGKGPYAVNIDWGDGANKLLSLPEAGRFSAQHAYRQPGCYITAVTATDGQGNETSAQTVALITGAKKPAGALDFIKNYSLDAVWPLFALCFGLISVFWLGERFELEKLRDKQKKSK